MTNDEFEDWLLQQGFTTEIEAIVRFNRNAPPARQVSSTGQNVIVKYPSVKNGETIPCESQLELACATVLERDPDVLEYRSQRPVYTANYLNKKGKLAGHMKTCDFFVIRRQKIEMIECKTEEMLAKISKKNPHLFRKDGKGQWTCPPGESYAKPYGFLCSVFSSADVNWKFQKNADFLFDYYADNPPDVPPEILHQITVIVRNEPGISYHDLTTKHKLNPDYINMLIATNRIYVDLEKELLVDTEETHLYCDKAIADTYILKARAISSHLQDVHFVDIEIGQTIMWSKTPWTIAAIDETHITLCNENGTVVKPLISIIEGLIKKGEIIGENKFSRKDAAEQVREAFYRRANKSDWDILNRRQLLLQQEKRERRTDELEQLRKKASN